MRICFRGAVLMLNTVLTPVMLGCTERADLAPVRVGHQRLNDAFPDVPYPPPVTSGNARPIQGRQEIPLLPRQPTPRALSPVKREVPSQTAKTDVIIPGNISKEKPKPTTIASKLTAKKSIMPHAKRAKPVPKGPVDKKKRTVAIAKTDNVNLSFGWPLAGKILKSYSQTGKKGIKISAKKGQTVRAAEAGKVVYSGQGLIGYGNLLIIKHNDQYLTAYANNSALLAKEGDVVKKGQGVATVGAGASSKAVLHFEIRKHGKSVNPLTLLP